MADADAAADERQLEEQARGHFERGDLEGARRLLEQAAELDDVHPSVLHNLGMVTLSLEDFDAAIQAYTRSVDSIPEGRVYRGLAFERTGHPDRARIDYERVLSVDPDNVDARVNLGTLELAEGEIESATAHLTRAAELDPTASWQLADAYIAQGDVSRGRDALVRAVAAGERRAHLGLAALDLAYGELEAAEGHLAAIAELVTDEADLSEEPFRVLRGSARARAAFRRDIEAGRVRDLVEHAMRHDGFRSS